VTRPAPPRWRVRRTGAAARPIAPATSRPLPRRSPAAAPDAAQQQSLSREIDQALQRGEARGEPDAKAAVPAEDAAAREQRQALEHWLQRVPDDPGGLLRRKFQLEYQQRQQRGGDGG
jgi:Ca-activated chloride channel family protein